MSIIKAIPLISTLINKDNWSGGKKLIEEYPQLIKSELINGESKFGELLDTIHFRIGKTIEKTKIGLNKIIELI